MAVHHFTAEADAAGVVHLDVPVGAAGNYEVKLVVEPAIDPRILATAEQRGWPPGFFDRFYGCIEDDSFVAPERRTSLPEAAFE